LQQNGGDIAHGYANHPIPHRDAITECATIDAITAITAITITTTITGCAGADKFTADSTSCANGHSNGRILAATPYRYPKCQWRRPIL
jgi:hypothetical protein